MAKRKLTQQQLSRIKKLQENQLEGLPGLIVAHYGQYVDVEDPAGNIHRCNLRQNLGSAVVGDRVLWHPKAENIGVLVAILPRRNCLSRPVAKTKTKIIAANIDQVFLVIAPEPKPAASTIDSYLAATLILNLPTVLVCNKSDLLKTDTDSSLLEQIKIYQHIGYQALFTSTQHATGLDDLSKALQDKTSILVGQSGVGKSSLLHHLAPENVTIDKTGASDHGTHTTTTARLFHLPHGGDLIDSPGIREFTLWDMPPAEIARGFLEFLPYLGHCKYRNCQHTDEPGCAILQAAAEDLISEQRLASYRRIVSQVKF